MRRSSGPLVALSMLVALLAVPGPAPAAAPTAAAPARTGAVLEVRVIGHSVKGRAIRAWRLAR
jgi:murein peptide amidase A